ncbi:MAG TPA: NAD(P)-binding protein [Baekduia sp.]|nr:NAD(P)-binding protein [Baekduia sp.]
MGMSERRRVAILGGGAGSLAAAFELTATPELRAKYDLTVYQLGWRCGGKGASGRRDVAGAQRIEEHGLHVWFGFYENAFDVMRRIYEELDRPADAPLRTWQDAFHPTNEVVLCDDTEDDRWIPRRFLFPPNDGVPGIPTDPPGLHRLLHDAIHTLRLVEPPEHSALHLKALDKFFDGFLLGLEKLLGGDDGESELADLFEGFLKFAKPFLHLGGDDGGDGHSPEEPLVCRFLRLLTDVIWKITDGDRYAMTFDLTATVFRGILTDRLDDEDRGGFAQVNDIEFTAWLVKHDARPATIAESPILRAFYQLCFAYKDGDRAQPCVAAGKALQAMLRMCLGYRGAIMWKMQAGMGDAIFAPMYEALRARGVTFEFFTEVTDIGVSPDGALVDRIAIRRQAQILNDAEYLPLEPDAGGLLSWPAEPLYDQLVGGHALGEVRFEYGQSAPDATDHTLKVGEDFDDVVLGISVASLPPITQELAASDPRFADMLAHATTVATQAFQTWMTRTPEHLGVDPLGMISGGYVPPLDTLCDMSHLLPREAWPADTGVVSVGYFCGTMEEPEGDTQDAADERAFAAGVEQLTAKALVLWPGACCDGEPDAFDWNLLFDPDDRAGDARARAQYWRANIFGSERYVITPPGSVEHRLRPSEAKATNLALAGDWTRNGICGGSVEAAVTSGKLASQHLSGSPAVVPGTEGWLESD